MPVITTVDARSRCSLSIRWRRNGRRVSSSSARPSRSAIRPRSLPRCVRRYAPATISTTPRTNRSRAISRRMRRRRGGSRTSPSANHYRWQSSRRGDDGGRRRACAGDAGGDEGGLGRRPSDLPRTARCSAFIEVPAPMPSTARRGAARRRVGLPCGDLDVKELVLADARRLFLTTPHWNGYAAVLIRIPQLARLERAELLELGDRCVVDARAETRRQSVARGDQRNFQSNSAAR